MTLRKHSLIRFIKKSTIKNYGRFLLRKTDFVSKYNLNEIIQLNSKQEHIDASTVIKQIGLSGHHDLTKNWDLLLSIGNATRFHKFENFLDAGSGSKSIFGQSMFELGYKHVYSCDLQKSNVKGVKSIVCDIEQTPYNDNFFSVIACLSVIEHGVDLRAFAREMYRICKPGGELMISTDFWSKEEDHSDKFPYGANNPPMKLFNNETLRDLLQILHEQKWEVPQIKEFSEPPERPVFWKRMNASYTFVWFKVKKSHDEK